jgi:hypothetical protein
MVEPGHVRLPVISRSRMGLLERGDETALRSMRCVRIPPSKTPTAETISHELHHVRASPSLVAEADVGLRDAIYFDHVRRRRR